MTTTQSVGIVAIGAYAPPRLLTNHDLETMVDTTDEWIQTRTGIQTRHIADPEMGTSHIAITAARQALERAGLAAEDVELIVVGSFTGDTPLPSTACLVQHALGAKQAAAFDVAAACTGFIYALTVAESMVATGKYRNALVVGADTLSRVTDYTDRGVCVLMGDGGGAAVLQAVPAGRGILATYLRADGGGADLLHITAGGSLHPASHETVDARQHYMYMNGPEVFKFAVKAIENAVTTVLDRAGLTTEDVALVVPHQANNRIIESAAKRLSIPYERWMNNIRDFGNTSGGSIPLALNQAYEEGRLHEGDVILLVGFGGGLTWGGVALRW